MADIYVRGRKWGEGREREGVEEEGEEEGRLNGREEKGGGRRRGGEKWRENGREIERKTNKDGKFLAWVIINSSLSAARDFFFLA